MKILFTCILFITISFAEIVNLKELSMKYQKENQLSEREIKGKSYAWGAIYYFGQGLKQDLLKAKAIYKRNNSDAFLSIYSKELEKLINLQILADETTGLDLLKKSLEIYKKTNYKDKWTIKNLSQKIEEWNNSNKIKFSPDKKSKIIEYKGDYLYQGPYDGYQRSSFIEIISPHGKVIFEDFYYGPFEFIKGYTFLDNNKVLIKLVSNTADGTYILDLVNFDMKLLAYGLVNNIQTIDSKKIINLTLKGYHDKGGAFWYSKSYNSDGKELEYQSLENFLYDFSEAHNSKNLKKLKDYYLNTIAYYTAKKYSKKKVMKDKKRFLSKYKNFNMKSKIFAIVQESEKDFIISYRKDVIYGKNNRKFDSQLKVRIMDGKVFIKEENDF